MSQHKILTSWPHQWYGFWRWEGHDYEELPIIEDAISLSWNPVDKDKIISYLSRSPIVISSMTTSNCLLCTEEVPSLCYHSDGLWLWPDSLAHYVRCHNVALPERFAQVIRERGYIPPQEAELPDVAVRDLPWPESWASMRNLSW